MSEYELDYERGCHPERWFLAIPCGVSMRSGALYFVVFSFRRRGYRGL